MANISKITEELGRSPTLENWERFRKESNNWRKDGLTEFTVTTSYIVNMAKSHSIAQSIPNASCNGFINALSHNVESADTKPIKTNARNTPKTCSNCGSIIEMHLSARHFDCDTCDMWLPAATINASENISQRAISEHVENHIQGEDRKDIPTCNANGIKNWNITCNYI